MTMKPLKTRTFIITLALPLTVVGIAAMAVSYATLIDVARLNGLPLPELFPIIIDTGTIACMVAAAQFKLRKIKGRGLAYITFLLLSAVSVAANGTHAQIAADFNHTTPLGAALIAAVPPLTLLSVTHLVMNLLPEPHPRPEPTGGSEPYAVQEVEETLPAALTAPTAAPAYDATPATEAKGAPAPAAAPEPEPAVATQPAPDPTPAPAPDPTPEPQPAEAPQQEQTVAAEEEHALNELADEDATHETLDNTQYYADEEAQHQHEAVAASTGRVTAQQNLDELAKQQVQHIINTGRKPTSKEVAQMLGKSTASGYRFLQKHFPELSK